MCSDWPFTQIILKHFYDIKSHIIITKSHCAETMIEKIISSSVDFVCNPF